MTAAVTVPVRPTTVLTPPGNAKTIQENGQNNHHKLTRTTSIRDRLSGPPREVI
jgi:hypothetical protein